MSRDDQQGLLSDVDTRVLWNYFKDRPLEESVETEEFMNEGLGGNGSVGAKHIANLRHVSL